MLCIHESGRGHSAHKTSPCHPVEHTHMNPPDRALVLCVDEKSQIQALDRT
jgi:hypothetical protein